VNNLHVAIVGPSLEKWKSNEQIEKAKEIITQVLKQYYKENLYLHTDRRPIPYSRIILVSGHCPKGGVDIWAEEKADELGVKTEIYTAGTNHWRAWECQICNPVPQGVTVVGEENNQLYAELLKPMCPVHGNKSLVELNGFRSRDIRMAEVCNVLYCIVPRTVSELHQCNTLTQKSNRNHFCIHCGLFGHPTNGGCWTMKKAKQLGKEVHLVVIE